MNPDTSGTIFNTVAGGVLRTARGERGISRPQLSAMLPSGIKQRTLQSYESGETPMSLERFAELCAAMKLSVSDILSKVLTQLDTLDLLTVVAHLPSVLAEQDPNFAALRAWAAARYDTYPGQHFVALTPDALRELAIAWGVSHHALARHLVHCAEKAGIRIQPRGERVDHGEVVEVACGAEAGADDLQTDRTRAQ